MTASRLPSEPSVAPDAGKGGAESVDAEVQVRPSTVTFPAAQPAGVGTVLDFFLLRFPHIAAETWRARFAEGSVWTVQGPPYIAWRRRHGGEILINWHDGGDLNRTALRLAWQTMLAYRKQRLWIERRLLEALGRVAHGGV